MKERSGIVYVTADEMRKIDELTIREFQIDVLILMENAGRATATLATRMLDETPSGKRIASLVGGGNNGGDGMVAARHLANWGAEVDVIVGTARDRVKNVPLRQLQILEKMGLPILFNDYDLKNYDLLVDGLIGYGLEGNPRERIATMINDANKSGRPILAVDLPSGMNATTGETYEPCIKAASTITLALPKAGFLVPESSDYLGDLYVADISIPRKIYKQFGQETELFQKDIILKV
jgi:NAD(P)H-hydrate epimerase